MERADLVAGLALGLALAACNGKDESAGSESYMDDDIPSTNCQGESDTGACAESTGAAAPGGGCMVTEDCPGTQVCVAPFDGERGEFACAADCIDLMDEVRWCADASACCDPAAICSDRGYCVSVGDGSTSEGSSGSSG